MPNEGTHEHPGTKFEEKFLSEVSSPDECIQIAKESSWGCQIAQISTYVAECECQDEWYSYDVSDDVQACSQGWCPVKDGNCATAKYEGEDTRPWTWCDTGTGKPYEVNYGAFYYDTGEPYEDTNGQVVFDCYCQFYEENGKPKCTPDADKMSCAFALPPPLSPPPSPPNQVSVKTCILFYFPLLVPNFIITFL